MLSECAMAGRFDVYEGSLYRGFRTKLRAELRSELWLSCSTIGSMFPWGRTFSFACPKEKVPKRKGPPLADRSAGQRVSYTLLSFGAIGRHGAGFLAYFGTVYELRC